MGHSFTLDEALVTEDDRPDLAAQSPEEQAFLTAIRRFSDRCLPCRGWIKVLEVGCSEDAGRAILLIERGHTVTVLEHDESARNSVRDRLEQRGLGNDALLAGGLEALTGAPYDAAVCFDPSGFAPDAVEAARLLRAELRPRGLLFGGPPFAGAIATQRSELERLGLSIVTDFGSDFPALCVRGPVGRLLAQLRFT